jgi:hypothetical protein
MREEFEGSFARTSRKTAEEEEDDDDDDEEDWGMTLNRYSCLATISLSLRDKKRLSRIGVIFAG